MEPIIIKKSTNSDEKFKELLRNNLNKLNESLHETYWTTDRSWTALSSFDDFSYLYEPKSLNDAITTLRVSINTKNKLKKYLKLTETYDSLIQRLIENYELFKEENIFLKEIEKKDRHLINYIEIENKREKKTLLLHPDFKIEFSYNDSKIKSYENFSFNLEIDNYVLQGKPMSEREGIKMIQTIDILRSIKKTNLDVDLLNLLKKKESLLENEEEFIKTKYLVYFKVLFFIINKKLDKKLNDPDLFNLDFWEGIYDSKNLSSHSLSEDVKQKLNKFQIEIEQTRIDKERNAWNIQLKN